MNYEKKGMIVHRSQRGKAVRIWAFTKDVEAFLQKFEEVVDFDNFPSKSIINSDLLDHLPNAADQEQKKQGKYREKIAFAIIISLIITTFIFWQPTRDHARKKLSYQLVKNSEGIIQRGFLVDGRGERIRELFQTEPGFDYNKSQDLENVGLPQLIALNHDGGTGNVLVDVIEGTVRIHRLNSVKTITVEDLMVTTRSGIKINDFVWGRVEWLNCPSFKGWAFLLYSAEDYPGALILFTSNFKEVGRLYHPGRLMVLFSINDYLYINGHLNAREPVRSGYRPMIFKIHISKILERRVQVNPFSSCTLTQSRLEYYSFKNMDLVTPQRYLAFPISSHYGKLFYPHRGTILFSWDFPRNHNLILFFDHNLNLIKKKFDEHEFVGNVNELDVATNFRVWEGKYWSDWKGIGMLNKISADYSRE